jgi:hypothetical protein
VELWWNFTDRGDWGFGGIALTGESGTLAEFYLQGRLGLWWNCTDRGDWSFGGITLKGENLITRTVTCPTDISF